MVGPALVQEASFDGMWRDSPLPWVEGRVGVEGEARTESSLDTWRKGSRKAGEGESTGLGASESDRGFGEPFTVVLEDRGVRSPSLCSICCVRFDLVGERPSPTGGACMREADIAEAGGRALPKY
jgi:hypothetical protein